MSDESICVHLLAKTKMKIVRSRSEAHPETSRSKTLDPYLCRRTPLRSEVGPSAGHRRLDIRISYPSHQNNQFVSCQVFPYIAASTKRYELIEAE
jgi:hypothetical protein